MPAMEADVEYSIGVNNRFIGLDNDSEDPFEYIKQISEKGPKPDKKAKGGKAAKTQEKPQQVHKKEVTIDDSKRDGYKQDRVDRQDRRDRPERGERGTGRGDRGRGRGGRGRGGRGRFNQDRGDRDGEQSEDRPHREDRGGFDRQDRGGFGGGFGGFGRHPESPKDDRFDGESRQSGGFNADGHDNAERSGGFGRGGRGRGFGGRGRGFGRGRGRGRDFDRRSGSDRSSVKPLDKREGSGSFNWGTPQDELEASQEPSNVFLTAEEEIKDWADSTEHTEPAEETKDQEEGETAPQTTEEAAKQMTLDEYKEMMERERAKVACNVRKANEGEKVPKDVKTIKKKNEEEEEEDGSLFFPRRYIEEKVKTSGRVKEHIKIDLKYGEPETRFAGGDGRGRRRGGRRGGRGAGGGGRGRGGDGDSNNGERGSGGFGSRGRSGGFGGGSGGGFGGSSGGFGGSGGAVDLSGLNLESTEEFPSLS